MLCLGDGALGTSPFELYLDYAARIEARSRTVLTLLVEFSSGCSGCLPTTKAVQGGGHSADADRLGPEGGQVLVEKSVRSINELWP